VSDVPRTIAGSRRVGREVAAQPRPTQVSSFDLPLYSDDLGRLPLHGQVNFQDTSPVNNMWYPQMGRNPVPPHATQTPMQNVPQSQDYSQPSIPGTYMDDMFYGHMSQFSTAQYQSQDTSTPYDDSAQGMQTLLSGPSVVDADTIAMWSNAPTGFELNDWGTYITNVSGLVNPDGTTSHSRHGA